MSSINSAQLQPTLTQRLGGYLALARISNSLTVVTNTLAGAALAGTVQPNMTVALVALAMVLFYTAGMFLNDLCDYALDVRQRPERPLPSGLVGRAEAKIATLALFGVGSALLLAAGLAPFISGLALIGMIVLYDMWHKTNPLSPVIMAVCRALVYVTAFLAVSTSITYELVIAATLLGLYIVGLTYIAKRENQPRFRNYWPVALLFLPVVYFVMQMPPAWAGLLFGAFGASTWRSITFVYGKQRNIGRAVGQLIAGIALVDSFILVAHGAALLVLLPIAAFYLTLVLQRFIKGT